VNRFKQLDILRACAVLLVFCSHMIPCPADANGFLHKVTTVLVRGGWIGVDLFFVLSGFLVAGLLFREYEKHAGIDVKRFLIRRGFKIYPPFWILIAVTTIFMEVHDGHVPRRGLVFELLFIQNYTPVGLWNHTWSLSVEEHFYLILVLGMFALARRSSRASFGVIPYAFVVLAALCLFMRITHAQQSSFAKSHYALSHLRIDSLLFGVVLSYYFHLYQTKFVSFAQRFRALLIVAGVVLLTPAYMRPVKSTPFLYTYGYTLFYLGSGSLVVAAMGSRSPKSVLARALAYAGSHSYSIYLWHMPVGVWGTALVAQILPQLNNWGTYAFVYLGGSIAFGIVVAVTTEFPVLRLRDRWFPSRGQALESDAPHSTDKPRKPDFIPIKAAESGRI